MPERILPGSFAAHCEAAVDRPILTDAMNVQDRRVFRGHSVWARVPVIEVALEVSPADAAALLPGLRRWFPACVGPEAGDATEPGAISAGTLVAQAWAALAAELQSRAWQPVETAAVERELAPGVYRVVVGYRDEDLAGAAVEEATALCAACMGGTAPDVAAAVGRLRTVAARACLPPSVWAIAEAAAARGIPWRRIGRSDILELGFGSRQRRASRVSGARPSGPADAAPLHRDFVATCLHAVGVPCAPTTDGAATADHALHRVVVAGRHLVSAARVGPDGGLSDVTGEVHSAVAIRCVEALRALELDVAVIDILARDLSKPLEAGTGGMAGVHPGLIDEGLLADAAAKARFGRAVVEHLVPADETGRIPIAAITGVNGKTTTTRLIARLVESLGHRVGMTCTDGVFVDGRSLEDGDCSGPQSARRVLLNPFVDAAVLEVARGGILREGLGFDRCDVAVVTNIFDGDHLGISWVKTPEDLARVKGVIVEAVASHGHAVLKADDPLVAAMAPRCPGRIVYFCRHADHPVVREHLRSRGRAVLERDGMIVIVDDGRDIPVIAAADVPLTRRGLLAFQVENVLAAVAAAHCLGVPVDRIRESLQAFDSDLATCPGRFNVLEHRGATVILDYGHNPSAVNALVEAVSRFPATRRHVVYSADGDRTDEQIRQQAANLAGTFERVVLYEEPGRMRGRKPGEIYHLLRSGLDGCPRIAEIEQVDGEVEAIRLALGTVKAGELVLVQVDAVAVDLAFVSRCLGGESATEHD